MARLSSERKELLARLVAEGTPISVLKHTYRFDPDTVKVYHPDYRGVRPRGRTLLELDPEKWRRLELMVEDGVSVTEIRRTLGVDHRTVKRYFPDYRPFRPGGWKHEGGEIRETNRKLREFERKGRISKHRDAGFTTRGRSGV